MPEPRYNPPHVDAVPQTRMPQPRPAPVITSTPPRHPTTPVDTRPRIAIGERLEFAGSWFTWDGRHFRNERAESELRAERIRRWRTLFFIAVVAFVAYLLIMSGLDWDRMSLEERAPYKGAGRIAVLILLVLGVRALQNMPWTVVPDLDREVRQKYGIGLLPALGPVAPTGTGGPPRFIVPERQNYLSGPKERDAALQAQRDQWRHQARWNRQPPTQGRWYDGIVMALGFIMVVVAIVVICYAYVSVMNLAP